MDRFFCLHESLSDTVTNDESGEESYSSDGTITDHPSSKPKSTRNPSAKKSAVVKKEKVQVEKPVAPPLVTKTSGSSTGTSAGKASGGGKALGQGQGQGKAPVKKGQQSLNSFFKKK